MEPLQYLAPFLGAVALEAVHWYELRERLHQAKFKRMVRSWYYWVPTLVMIILGAGIVLVWNADQPESRSAFELLVAGAGAPTLLKKFVATFLARQSTMLGESDDEKPSVRDYFVPA